jgi:pilus assembly protein CpaE
MPEATPTRESRALLISPDRRVLSDLTEALTRALPAVAFTVLRAYPEAVASAEGVSKPAATVCFLDVSSDPEVALRLLGRLAGDPPQRPVVALLADNDPDLILRSLRGGAAEFLVLPATSQDLCLVAQKLSRLGVELGGAGRSGDVCCVMPGKGGSGATALAVSLAHALRRLKSGRVLLADLDSLAGTVAFHLNLKSQYSFLDVLNHREALNAEVWRTVTVPSNGVDVLLAPQKPVDFLAEPLDCAPLVCSARLAYDAIVLDSNGAFGEWNLTLARSAQHLLMVTTSELPALHATQQALSYLEENGVARRRVRIILNRYSAKTGLRCEAVEQALQAQIFATLPADGQTLRKALLEGRPAPPASPFGKGVATIARALSDNGASLKRKPSLPGRLLALGAQSAIRT